MFKAMGYIKEPDGVDFFVDSKPLTERDKKEISELIAYYKKTGRKSKLPSRLIHHDSTIGRTKTQLVKR